MGRAGVVIVAIATVAGIAVGTSGVGAAGATPAAAVAAARACPVTVVPRKHPPPAGFGPSGFNYGTPRLRVHLYWPGGTLPAGDFPDGGAMATIGVDGSISAKVGWWVRDASTLVISGRRLDGRAEPMHVHIPAGYGPPGRLRLSEGFQPTGLDFPTTGCWRVDGRAGSARLSFVVRVTKLKT